MSTLLVAGLVLAIFAAFTVLRAVRIVPQARARNVERLGRYQRTPHTRPQLRHPLHRPRLPADRPA